MTTVCYDGATIAADRFWGTCYGDKLVRVGNLAIGFAGSSKMFNRVIDYFTSGGDPPALEDANEVLVVDLTTGKSTLYHWDMDPLEVDAPIAIGSGQEYAMGYMLLSLNAEGAVRAAALYDAGTKVDYGITTFEVGVPVDSTSSSDRSKQSKRAGKTRAVAVSQRS